MNIVFIETHMHISLDGQDSVQFRKQIKENKEIAEQRIRENILAYKSRGIFAMRDGGDPINLASIARKIADEEGVIYKTPIHAIYKRGNYGGFIGKPIDDIKDFKRLMHDMEKQHPDFIKIPLTGMMNFDVYGDIGEIAFTQKELDYIVDYSKDKDYPVMVHVNSKEGIQRAIKAGVNTIEHGYFITEEELWAMKERGVIWVPTLAPLGNILYSNDQRYYNQLQTIRRIFNEQCHMVLKAYEIGVKLAVGSDAGAYRVLHGSGFFNELEYMNRAGIKREELVRLSYENGCEALNLTKDEISLKTKN